MQIMRIEDLYNESNPVDDTTVLDELPASNGHEYEENILREEMEQL